MDEDEFELKITDDFGDNARPGAFAGTTKDGKFKWMYGKEFERDSITGLFGTPKYFFNQSNPKKGKIYTKTMFIALILSAGASPAFAWGFGPNECLNNSYVRPTAVCGSYYRTFTGTPYAPTSATTFQPLTPGGPIQTFYNNGASATTFQPLTPGGPVQTYYSGF